MQGWLNPQPFNIRFQLSNLFSKIATENDLSVRKLEALIGREKNIGKNQIDTEIKVGIGGLKFSL